MDESKATPTTPNPPGERAPRATGKSEKARGSTRNYTPEERLLLLDVWQRSELPAPRFGELLGISGYTLYQWKKRFDADGPAGLEDRPKGTPRGSSRLPEPTQRAILMLKREHPDWGSDRIRDMLLRSQGYGASSGAIQRVLIGAGYQVEAVATRPHPPKQTRRFERARPNQLWQTDLFTFLLKRENRRLYLVVFMDDRSRFVVCHAVSAGSSGALVRECLEAGIARYGPPEEVLSDNGPQYHTWRGTSAFTRLLRKRGIRHIVSRPKHPQTLGKVERFWQTLWNECLESAVLRDDEDARVRIGHFIDHYNFQRTHQGLDGLVPADRYFEAESEVRKAIEARVKSNALELAREGVSPRGFYLTGQVEGRGIAVHGEAGKLILTRDGAEREEVTLAAPPARPEAASEASVSLSTVERVDDDDADDDGDDADIDAEEDWDTQEEAVDDRDA